MDGRIKIGRVARFALGIVTVIFFAFICTISVNAEDTNERVPDEYTSFIDSIDDSVTDKLPEGVFSSNTESVSDAAAAISDPANVFSLMIDLLGEGIRSTLPTLGIVLGIVILSALLSALSSHCGAFSRAVEMCTRLCTFCALSAVAVYCVKSLSAYFEGLFAAVGSFLPLSAVLFAMGGNLNAAVANSASLAVVLTICEFFCTKTVIPVFCICLCLSLLSVFEGVGASTGQSISSTVRKWYMTALSFVMIVLTFALGASNLLAIKADNLAMKSAKFAVSSFVPVAGGTISSTLGTLAASVELLRGSIGVIGVAVMLLMLLPTVIELALLRGVFVISGFCASVMGCSGEARLLGELDSLYGYLEGIAALSAAVFVIAFGVFAAVTTPFS